ncbi:Reticulocyte-binding protein 2 a [Orchesella cincta]|uniref:Reticulocyte-binding protein 2 a n=1 Tax=Orchesella cincta TaxID=48709 RepID=A0A1D2MLP9_ORCCI|nr:Reticulocyte-binding protein 2 a [Orchesella cincta]
MISVKNDGMSDQEKPSIQNRGSAAAATNNTAPPPDRPGSARSNRDRHERVILLKERQNSERIKKLEELKEQALAAARLRDEQDSKRRRHFEELGKKDEERRRQAEERRRMLEEERRVSLQAKWEGKRAATPVSSRSNKPAYAFGSCTPRLLDNHVDGFLWKSQYNLNAPREPGLRASSAHDLHLQQTRSRYSCKINNSTMNLVEFLLLMILSDRRDESSMETPMRVFCGRRKTDLVPTIVMSRDSAMSRSRSPGGNVTQHHQLHQGVPQRPSRSKSTTHLQSAGLKLTRTEILRQALASKKESFTGGIRSVDGSRPPSSMSSSLMTSSTHSQVQMRRNPYALRKTRPASVHVTGISSGESEPVTPNTHTAASSRRSDTPASAKSAASRKASNELSKPRGIISSGASGKSSGKTSPLPMSQSMYETSTMKRPIKKKLSPSVSNSSAKLKTPEPPAAPLTATREQSNEVVMNNKPAEKENAPTPITTITDQSSVNNKPAAQEFEIINNQQEQQVPKPDSGKQNVDNFESIESAFASGSEDFTYNSKTPEPFAPTPDSNTNTSELLESAGRDSGYNPFIDNVTPEPTLELQELERQRLEEEEAERLASTARKLEEERLRKAIEEENERQDEEKKRKEEEEKARLEKEKQERAALKEAERIRLEMEERLRREELERLEKKRVENIMKRTRKKEAEQQQAKANNTNSNEGNSDMIGDVNGLKESIINEENSMQSSVNSVNNNFNNNNDFSGSTLDNGGSSSSSNNTLISFEGMGNTNTVPSSELLVPESRDNIGAEFLESSGGVSGTTSPNTPPLIPNSLTGSSSNNPIMNNPLQDLLS